MAVKEKRTICQNCGHYADNMGYDPTEFSIPASDDKGHSEKLWVKLPPEYAHEITAIVHSPLFPWTTPAALIRWCIHHGLKFLFSLKVEHPNHFAMIEANNRIVQRYELASAFGRSIERASEQVNTLIAQGAKAEAARMINELRASAKKMPPGFWRDKYIGDIETRFGYLISNLSKPASLVPREEDDGFAYDPSVGMEEETN